MIWADWRYNEEIGQWETIVHCKSSEEAKDLAKKLRTRKYGVIVKDNKIIVNQYIPVYRLEKILGIEVEY